MAASFSTTPARWAHSQSPIWIKAASDNVVSNTRTNFLLVFDEQFADGHTLTFEWLDFSLIFNILTGTPGQMDLPPTSASPTEAEVRAIIDYLYRNDTIARYWSLSYQYVSSQHRIVGQYRTKDAVDLTLTVAGFGPFGPNVTVTNKADLYLEDNLTCMLQVLRMTTLQEDTELLQELIGSYNPEDGVCAFDIHQAFNLKPHLPTWADNTFDYGRCTDSFNIYRVQIADRYGDPQAPERMLPHSPLVAILGGGSLDMAFTLAPGGDDLQILHHHYDLATAAAFRKPIAYDGYDFLYFILNADTSVLVKVKAYYYGGTDASFDLNSGTPVLFEKDNVFWLPSGPAQLDFSTLVTDWEDVYAYDIELWNTAGDDTLITSHQYEVDWKCRDWYIDLLFANGVGGMEIFRATGKAERNTAVSMAVAAAQATPDDTTATGQAFTFDTQGSDKIKIETGWLSPYYANFLAQILHSDIWINKSNEWVRYYVEQGSVNTTKDDDQISAYSFTIIKALDQPNHVI